MGSTNDKWRLVCAPIRVNVDGNRDGRRLGAAIFRCIVSGVVAHLAASERRVNRFGEIGLRRSLIRAPIHFGRPRIAMTHRGSG